MNKQFDSIIEEDERTHLFPGEANRSMVASSIDDAPFSRVGGTVYNKQSHAIAFGAGDANFTKFGLLPMSF